jgi:hypothetical protein
LLLPLLLLLLLLRALPPRAAAALAINAERALTGRALLWL